MLTWSLVPLELAERHLCAIAEALYINFDLAVLCCFVPAVKFAYISDFSAVLLGKRLIPAARFVVGCCEVP